MINQIKKTLFELIQIDSPSGQEDKVRALLKKKMKSLGFSIKIDNVGNLYTYKKGIGNPILLCAHMDTVQPGEGIKPFEENGIIKSEPDTILGADNKAAVATILTVIEKKAQKIKRPMEVLFTIKEETGGGVEHLPKGWIKSKIGFCFDNPNSKIGGIVLRSPFVYNFTANITGKTSHASFPKEGKNALIPAIKALAKMPMGWVNNDLSVNIGLINGGLNINSIPAEVTIKGEVRCYNKSLFYSSLKKVEKSFLTECKKAGVVCKFTKSDYCKGYTHPKNSVAITLIEKIIKNIGFKIEHHMYSVISDTNTLTSKNLQVVNLSDGVQNAHTTEEEIALKDLEKLSVLVESILLHTN